MPVIRPITAHEASYNGATHQLSIDYQELQKAGVADNTGKTYTIPLGARTATAESTICLKAGELKKAFKNYAGDLDALTITLGQTNALNAFANALQIADNHNNTITTLSNVNEVPINTTANLILTISAPGANKNLSDVSAGLFVAYFAITNSYSGNPMG